MALPGDPSKPPAPAPPAASPGGPQATPRYTGPDPRVCCCLLRLPGPSDKVLEVITHVTARPPLVTVGAESLPVLRGPLSLRLDSTLPPGEKPVPASGAQAFDLEVALARFQGRAYAVARVGPGVALSDSTESTATGLQKAAWKLPRPC